MSITDTHNSKKVPPYLIPLIAGFVVLAIGMTFGFNCGYAINPARDLSPRFFTYLAGWGTEVFRFCLARL